MKKVEPMSEKEKHWKVDILLKSSNILITIKNVLHHLVLFLPLKTRFSYMYIHTYSYSDLQKVVIARFLNLLFDSTGEIVKAREIFFMTNWSHLG